MVVDRYWVEVDKRLECTFCRALCVELTGAFVTYIEHDFRGTLYICFNGLRFQFLDQNTHASEGRDKVEHSNDTKFQEVRSLKQIGE